MKFSEVIPMTNVPMLLGFGFICIATIILGSYLGRKGFAATFADASNPMRIPIMLVASLPFPLVLWLQSSYGFVATPVHIGIAFACFAGAWVIGTIQRSSSESLLEPSIAASDFRKAMKILIPLRDQYYIPGYQLAQDKLQEIAMHRGALEQSIIFFQSARELKLAEGTSGKRDAAVALHEIGMVHRLLDNLEKAKANFLAAYSEIQDMYHEFGRDFPRLVQDLGILCLHLGDVEDISGNYQNAIDWYKRAVSLSQQAGDDKTLQSARRLLDEAFNM
jgi:hypothetical protein